MRYFVRKIGFYLVAAFIALVLNFVLPRLVKGNPVDIVLAKTKNRTPLPPEARQALEVQFGISDQPLPVQFVEYLRNTCTGNFGLSVTYYPTPVTEVITDALPWTVGLIGLATIISYLLGVLTGAWLGWRRGTWTDQLIPVSTFFSAIPYFWLALVLVYLLGTVLTLFPVSGGYSLTLVPHLDYQFIGSVIYYGFLPALTIVVSSVAGQVLGMRNMMISTLSEDFVTTARAKGLKNGRIFGRYAMRNALLPSVAGFAMSLGFIVNGSVVTESVFAYPGLGFSLLQAVQNSDYPLMQALFLVITLAVLGANLLVDLIYGFIDPRTRLAS